MGKADRLQETGEISYIPHQPFHLDFFPEIESGIGAQYVVRVCRGINKRKQTALKRLVQTKTFPKLRAQERMHGPQQRPSTQQIHTRIFQLARTRTGQYKPIALFFLNELVDYGKQLRNLLDFVDHKTFLPTLPANDLSKTFRFCRKGTNHFWIKQIDIIGVRKASFHEG